MRARRPRRRGDWGRRLSALDSLSSDSDNFPCDSSCSGDSFSSQDNLPLDPTNLRRRIRSTPVPKAPPLDHSPPRHLLPHEHPSRPFVPRPPAPRSPSAVDIRDLSLSEYAAAELPDIGFFLKTMLPSFGPHPASIPASPSGGVRRGAGPGRASRMPSRRRSAPPLTFPRRDRDRALQRPPAFPDAARPTQVQFARRREGNAHPRESSPRQEASKRVKRMTPVGKMSPKVDTRRYPDDIASSRAVARRTDPDSLHRFLLVERLWSLYQGFIGGDWRHGSSRHK